MSVKYMTIDEYAEWKKVGVQVVRREIGKGKIKAEKIGRSWRIPVEDD